MSSQESSQESSPSAWSRQEGESNLWHGRFQRYLRMGYARTMIGCVRLEQAGNSRKKPVLDVPGAWNVAAKQWKWKERAAAWDKAEPERIHKERMAELDAERRRHVELGRMLRDDAAAAIKELKKADLPAPVLLNMLGRDVQMVEYALTEPIMEEMQARMDGLEEMIAASREPPVPAFGLEAMTADESG